MNAIVPAGGNTALTPTNMESAIQLAEMMASGKLVPQHLHNSPGDCLMVIEASMRWQMSPFAVAQCTSVIQGKLMFEGKLVAAALNASGILSSRLDYDFSGEGAQRAVTVRGKLRGETKDREVTVFLADAKTSNGMWTKQPDQQLVYAGTRVWARRHAPEVMLGVYAPEEFDRAEPFDGQTIEHAASDEREQMNREVPLKAAAADMKRADKIADKAKVYDAASETDEEKWWRNLEIKLATARSQAEVMKVGELKSVKTAKETGPPEVQERVMELLAKAYERFPTDAATWTPDLSDELPEVEINGADKVMSGDD